MMLLQRDLMHILVPHKTLILLPVKLNCKLYIGVKKVSILAKAEISLRANCSIGGEFENSGYLMTANGFFLFYILNLSSYSTFWWTFLTTNASSLTFSNRLINYYLFVNFSCNFVMASSNCFFSSSSLVRSYLKEMTSALLSSREDFKDYSVSIKDRFILSLVSLRTLFSSTIALVLSLNFFS